MGKLGWLMISILSFICMTNELIAQTLITNEESEKHQIIPGAKVSMIPAPGFSIAESFTGLQNLSSQSTIMVMQVSTPYTEYINQAIPIITNNTRSKMTERASYNINGLPAKLFVGTQKGDSDSLVFNRIFFVLGNETETIALNCHYPQQADRDGADNGILETILSVRYLPELTIDPQANMGFRINTDGTSFQFTRKTGSALQFVQQQKNNWSPAAFFIDRKSLTGEVSDKATFMLRQVDALFELDSTLFSRDLQVPQGITAHEVFADLRSKKTGQITQAYFITLFGENRAYSMIGYNVDATAMEEMKTIARSLEIL